MRSNIGRRGKRKSSDGRLVRYVIDDEIVHTQFNAPHKIIVLQKIVYVDDNSSEFRLAYYIIGKKPRMRGKWVFGQFATLIPQRDFRAIVTAAKQKGWI